MLYYFGEGEERGRRWESEAGDGNNGFRLVRFNQTTAICYFFFYTLYVRFSGVVIIVVTYKL